MRFALPRASLLFCSSLRNCRITSFSTSLPRNCPRPAGTRPSGMAAKKEFNREELDELLKRRFFISRSFDIYGGVAGLYDLGPPGCALQANIVDTWRRHFILEEDMLEVDCTMLTPEVVLQTSGHVARFADWMCKDKASGEIFRADHLVEQVLEDRLKSDKEARGQAFITEDPNSNKKKLKIKKKAPVKLDEGKVALYDRYLAQIDNFDGDDLARIIKEEDIRNPQTGGVLEPPIPFNLMFETQIGPSGDKKGYLRPETAQGQFLNFQKLLDFNNSRMPFASASIGKSFRNEISPRSGLLRVREFLMAEIEHYVDPKNKKHDRFKEVEKQICAFLPRGVQDAGSTQTLRDTIGHAVETKMVDNETLGYFLARIWMFFDKIGCDMSKIRFRQHMRNEMAHYASDCWDAELLTSYGWIECVGCADRSAFDLTMHSNATNQQLVARKTLDEPVITEVWEAQLNRKKVGPKFKTDLKALENVLEEMDQAQLEETSKVLAEKGQLEFKLPGKDQPLVVDKDDLAIERVTKKQTTYEYIPNVIEPSFGIGRIVYSLMEHVFWQRAEDEQRAVDPLDAHYHCLKRKVLSFPALVAPVKCLLVPLSNHVSFHPITRELSRQLRNHGISNKVDDSGSSIGKRYSRNDELGTPYGITVDFQTVKDGTITLRERDSTKQIRATPDEVFQIIKDLVDGRRAWDSVIAQHGEFVSQEV